MQSGNNCLLLLSATWDKLTLSMILEQGLADFFCKGPDKKYFRACGPQRLCLNYSTLVLTCKISPKQHGSDRGCCVPTGGGWSGPVTSCLLAHILEASTGLNVGGCKNQAMAKEFKRKPGRVSIAQLISSTPAISLLVISL